MATLTKAKLAEIRKQKRKADEAWRLASRLAGGKSDADRMRETRAKARELTIPDCANPDRRAACEADDVLWLRTYCPSVFYNPFTPHQMRIIADCGEALRYGTSKCKAAPRGDGKSSIVKYLAEKYALTRMVKFPLIIAATSKKAGDTLDSIKRHMASGGRYDKQTMTFIPTTPLGEDYPLECAVAAYVNPWPSRARNVLANDGREVHVEWGPEHIIFPTWSDIEPLGPIAMALGITSDNIQGCNIYDQRPDFVMLDDLDSRDSLAAEDGAIAAKIEDAIEKTIGGLAGQSRKLGQFYLCTITSRDAAAYKYSDPLQKPAWSGERIPAILKWPTQSGMWEQYQQMRQYGQSATDSDGKPIDPFGRKAFAFYRDNREAMDEGAELANPYNFIETRLPDGTPTHLSALQKCYDFIADKGLEAFLTEYQNDPPATDESDVDTLTALQIQRKVNGYDRGVIPPQCELVTVGVDVRKTQLHWTARAWDRHGSGHTIHYGIHDVIGTVRGSDDGLDVAIHNAIIALVDKIRRNPFCKPDGEIIDASLILIDAGYRTDAVYGACHKCGVGVMPIMGFGKSSGCTQANFSEAQRATVDKRPGDGWFLSRKGRMWLVCADADRWKAWEHDRWRTDADKPGSMQIWGRPSQDQTVLSDDETAHQSYARHIVSETEIEEMHKGSLRRKWKAKGSNNHWLDASYYASVAMSIRGLRIQESAPTKTQTRTEPAARPSLKDLAGRGNR